MGTRSCLPPEIVPINTGIGIPVGMLIVKPFSMNNKPCILRGVNGLNWFDLYILPCDSLELVSGVAYLACPFRTVLMKVALVAVCHASSS
jgi:hypothetical protein